MNRRFYFKCKSWIYGPLTLAPVIAETEEEAWELLPKQHEWINAGRHNCHIEGVVVIADGCIY